MSLTVRTGPSKTGKSTMLFEEIVARHCDIIKPSVDKIVVVYEIWQPLYEDKKFSKVTFTKSLDAAEEILLESPSSLLILDDQMQNFADAKRSKELAQFVQVKCHHQNVSVIVVLHNFFNKYFHEVTTNSEYLILFRHKMNAMVISHIGKFKIILLFHYTCY